MARKWQKLAAIGQKRIVRRVGLVAEKGHFVVYSGDGRRFVLPLEYLNDDIFRELLRIAEEEFGLPRDGPITLPCDASQLECIVASIRQRNSEDSDKVLVLSKASGRCSSFSYSHQETISRQLRLICSF
ncbi:hypothetical protein FEM48_Zijuj09G0158800 [Ziziphus jujuba var. spinosa]|uniref:Auxin-responsive protein SAUR36-like n=1 Tax=Ziziphus jujuba var. spinosa TaxID=714518 RepID=A0A978UTW9_ZIZJJ|nr:hypothetical protein FEM48_Zijuj09G0158800 [Ziziphus jujuba var. spinosa]